MEAPVPSIHLFKSRNCVPISKVLIFGLRGEHAEVSSDFEMTATRTGAKGKRMELMS